MISTESSELSESCGCLGKAEAFNTENLAGGDIRVLGSDFLGEFGSIKTLVEDLLGEAVGLTLVAFLGEAVTPRVFSPV